jgi:hypothetical protein
MATVGGAIGPVGAGVFFDLQKTYVPVFYLFIGLMLVTAIVSMLMRSAHQPMGVLEETQVLGVTD